MSNESKTKTTIVYCLCPGHREYESKKILQSVPLLPNIRNCLSNQLQQQQILVINDSFCFRHGQFSYLTENCIFHEKSIWWSSKSLKDRSQNIGRYSFFRKIQAKYLWRKIVFNELLCLIFFKTSLIKLKTFGDQVIVKLRSLVSHTERSNISERNSNLIKNLKKGPEVTL